jgi:hypothetical protein
MMTQKEIDNVRSEMNQTLAKVNKYHARSEASAYCMCGAAVCLIVDMATGRVVEMPRLSSFWTTAILLLVFVILLWCTEHLRQELAILRETMGFVAHDVTVKIPND